MEVGYIGLGAMGGPMAANLARAFRTKVWNRTTETALEHARQHGSEAVTDLAELGSCDAIFSCLPTDAEVAEVATRLAPELAPGTVWVDHTSGRPQGSREIAERLAAGSIDYLDAPVSGGVKGAVAGTLTIMIGGDQSVVDRVRPPLDAMADKVVVVGPIGAGMTVKAINNALSAVNLWAAAEGVVALSKAGVPASTALSVINASSGSSKMTQNQLTNLAATGAYPPLFALDLLAKDVRIANEVLDDVDLDSKLLTTIRQLTTDASEELGPGADHVEIVKLIEAAAQAKLR